MVWFACRKRMGEISSGRGAGGRGGGCRRRRSSCTDRRSQWRFNSTSFRRGSTGRCLGESGRRVLGGGPFRIPSRTGSRSDWIPSLFFFWAMNAFGCPQIALCFNILFPIGGYKKNGFRSSTILLHFCTKINKGFPFIGSGMVVGPIRLAVWIATWGGTRCHFCESHSWWIEELSVSCCAKYTLLHFPFSFHSDSCFFLVGPLIRMGPTAEMAYNYIVIHRWVAQIDS